jgi:DNA-binding GntR family transcriptional regulator
MRASDRAYELLRDDIVSWRLLPGTALSEIELAERLGVSRTPLRSALTRLALEGLVDTSRGRTGVVPDVSARSVVELFELREALETHAARLAARRRDPAVFAALAAAFAHAGETLAEDGVDAYYAVVADFDRAVDDAIANPALLGALEGVRTHLVRARRVAAANPARLLRAAEEHRLICEAIRDGDESLAAAATTVHLRVSSTEILSVLDARAHQEGVS